MRPILVPVDGSPFSEHAIPVALGLARRLDASAELVLVHPPATPLAALRGGPGDPEEDEAVHRVRATHYASLLGPGDGGAAGAGRVTAAVLAGPVAATLGARAREIGAALVVMATHGRSGVARALLGSVAEAVVRDVAVPVLLVKPAPGAAPDDELAPPFRRVVVPLDGDAPAEAALDAALAIAPASDATYVLVRVIPAAGGAPHHEPSIDGAPPEAARLEADRVRAAEYLDGIARGMRARGVQVETETIAAPRAADGILACAAERNADLIALATRAPRGAARVLIGSVGDDVLRGARCAVLLARVAG